MIISTFCYRYFWWCWPLPILTWRLETEVLTKVLTRHRRLVRHASPPITDEYRFQLQYQTCYPTSLATIAFHEVIRRMAHRSVTRPSRRPLRASVTIREKSTVRSKCFAVVVGVTYISNALISVIAAAGSGHYKPLNPLSQGYQKFNKLIK